MMLKFWRKIFLLFVSTFIVADTLIGLKFYQNDATQCGLSLYHLPQLSETKWIKLDSHYPFPCFSAMIHPNQIHFTLATDSYDDVFITAIFADWDSKVYKVAYLDPETNEFSSFKELTIPSTKNCFHKDSQISGLLNFKIKNGTGKIRISKPNACDVKFTEKDFFSNETTTLGIMKEVPGIPVSASDDNEANNEIYQAFQQNPKHLNKVMLSFKYSYFNFILPFSVSKPSMFVSGNYAIFKNLEYNISGTKEKYLYSLIDLTELKPSPSKNITISTFSWQNYVYIFDEKYFDKSLSLPPPGIQDLKEGEENSVSNKSRILKIPLMMAFIAAFSKIIFYH